MILGTAAYMSPEQARGQVVDKRADIWAFGVVLYEMLTGQRLFGGETISDTLAQVLTKEPELNRVPEKVRRLLRRCLAKDPRRRLRDIGDVDALLEDLPAPVSAVASQRPAVVRWAWPSAAALLLAAVGLGGWVFLRPAPPQAEPIRFVVLPPDQHEFSSNGPGLLSISPDGRRLAFVAQASGKESLWVRMVTPSGSNSVRGSVFEFNRDSKFSANSFFNNASGVEKPALKRNQFRGRLGGPIVKNKLFFFGNYEGFRQTTQTAQNLTIPANDDFTSGVFRYVALDGSVRSVNVSQLSGLPIDPTLRRDVLSKFPAASNVNNFLVGNSTASRLLNTAGYRFNQTRLNNRNQWVVRLDYAATPNHKFEGVYSDYRENVDRTDLDRISPDRPLVTNEGGSKRYALAWQWVASSRFQNEVRVDANLDPNVFNSAWDYSSGVLYNTVLSLTNPVGGNGTNVGFQPQGRFTDTYQYTDTASLVWGSHEMQIGGSLQQIRANPYNYAGRHSVVGFGFSSNAPPSVQLFSGMFPGGISAADLDNANAMAAFLGGITTWCPRPSR